MFVKRKQEVPHKPGFPAQKPGPVQISGDLRPGNSAGPAIIPTETDKENETKPEETKSEETKIEESKSEQTKPEETKPEETKPEETGKSKRRSLKSPPSCPSSLRPGTVQQAENKMSILKH